MKTLIINTGSASKKYALYEEGKRIYYAHFEMEPADGSGGAGGYVVTETFLGVEGKEEKVKTPVSGRVFERAQVRLLDSLMEKKIIKNREDISSIGIRIVAPGEYFLVNRLIDRAYLKMVKQALEKVPLHLGPALAEIKMAGKVFGNVKMVGVSDSAFHKNLPEKAKFYAISMADSRNLGLQKFGYHGISLQSVISQTEIRLGKLPEKTIVCHLGGGASVTALRNGVSVETSMGFTPLDGLVMATRVGEINPGAVLYLADKLGLRLSRLEEYFNEKCGLLGLSGKSGDVRDLLKFEAEGDKDSKLALEIYADRLKKYIGAASAVLGGVDFLIFAGTVGERSFIMRGRICDGLQFLGVDLNMEVNNKSEGVEAEISQPNARVKVLVIKTNEMEEMAKATVLL